MLDELQRKHDETARELNTERSRRISIETELNGERSARTVAEQERDNNAARVVTEAEQKYNAQVQAVKTQITSLDRQMGDTQAALERALESGDHKEVGRLQRSMAEIGGEIATLKQQDRFLETNKERIVPKVPAPTERRPATPTPSGRYAGVVGGPLHGGEEAWLDKRPQFMTDEGYRQAVFNASALAARKHTRGTDDYLRELERIMGEEPANGNGRQPPRRTETQQQAEDEETGGAPARQPAARQDGGYQSGGAPSADLPASRRAGPGQNPGGRVQFTLTPQQREIADGMWGNPNNTDPNSPFAYIPDEAERYRKYWENDRKMKARQQA
jgi:hypothetical protein